MISKYGFFSLLLLLCVSACTKIEETQIGTDLIPIIDGVITKDTNLYINAKTWGSTDSISPYLYDDHALGYINDPLFGTTQASVNLQLLPVSFPNTFEVSSDSLFLDSVVLALDVRGVWGDTNQNLSLHVKELDNDLLFLNDTVSSTTGFTYLPYDNTSELPAGSDVTYNGMASIDPKTWNDSIRLFKDSAINMIRIRLTDELGNRLLHTFLTGGQYDSVLAFKTAFKGLQVSADATGNSLLRIGLSNSSTSSGEENTKLALYYRYQRRDSTGKQDTTVKNFTINTSYAAGSGSAHSNYIKRQYNSGQIAGYYPSTTSSANDDYVYIQSAPGTYATLTVDSGITKLPNWIIHRAEIVMEQAPDGASPLLDNYTAPFLFLLGRQSESQPFEKDTTKFVIPGFDTTNPSTSDALFSSALLANYGDFGGFPRRGTFGNTPNINYYNFDLSRYVQGIVTNKNKPYPFVLYTPYREIFQITKGVLSYGRISSTPPNSAGIGRVKLYGGGIDSTNTHRMKLHIVYSIPH